MKKLTSIGVAWLMGILILNAEYDPFSPTSEDNKPPKMPPEPDHLMPVDPYHSEWELSYNKLLTKHLSLDSVYFARMIVKPSFTAEYSMRLHGDKDSYDVNGANEFFITCSIPDKSIWYSLPENNDEKKQKEINVKVISAPIQKTTAKKICRIWDEMILRTRYSRDYGAGLDGVTVEFSSVIGHGTTWSPMQRKSPLLFRELGASMVSYCKVSAEQRKKAMKIIETRITALEKHLNKTSSNKKQAEQDVAPNQ